MGNRRPRWSDLPPELWPLIGKRLQTSIDVVRCRGVCRSWRASLPPLNAISLSLPLDFPSPIDADNLPTDTAVFRRTIYRLCPLDHHQSSSNSASSPPRAAEGWLAKVEATKLGKMRFLRPLSTSYFRYNYGGLRKEVNLLDFRIHEVAKSYTLGYTNGTLVRDITKVVMFPDSPWTDAKNSTVVAVYAEGKLGFAKHGDDKWTLIDDKNFHYDDVIVYKGQFYAVDRRGTVFRIDESMKLIEFSPPLRGSCHQKHLVESGGELYVVDRFVLRKELRMMLNVGSIGIVAEDSSPKAVIDFKVYRMDVDEDWGSGRLVEVRNLGNEAFVLSNEGCFSVSATEFEGIKGNCIYFTREPKEVLSYYVHVFELEERILRSTRDDKQFFRPPPMLVDLNAPHCIAFSAR